MHIGHPYQIVYQFIQDLPKHLQDPDRRRAVQVLACWTLVARDHALHHPVRSVFARPRRRG